MNSAPFKGVDKRRAAAAFDKAARTYDDHDLVQREVAARLIDRLQYTTVVPRVIADLGSGTGRWARTLAKRYPRALIVQCDFACNMLHSARGRGRNWFSPQRYLCTDIERLALGDDTLDLAFSSMALQWCADIRASFAELKRTLKPGGLLMFTTLGPDTLLELRHAWAQVSSDQHVNQFLDMHDIGDMLMHCGFGDPVMECERITVNYDSAVTLMKDLKAVGASNASFQRRRTMIGKKALTRVIDAYEKFRHDGKLPATYEVVFGHAWASATRTASREHTFPIERLRRR